MSKSRAHVLVGCGLAAASRIARSASVSRMRSGSDRRLSGGPGVRGIGYCVATGMVYSVATCGEDGNAPTERRR